MDSSAENSPAARLSVTDSPWFWLMLFSCMSLVAMQLIDWKYNQRQARLERQFQGRQWAAEHGAKIEMDPSVPLDSRQKVPLQEPLNQPLIAAENPSAVSDHPEYSRPGHLVSSLWPLKLLAGVALCVSLFMWRKQRLQELKSSLEQTPPPPGGSSAASPPGNSLPEQQGVTSS